jgi:putative SOS response-associated peptidase YedK
MCGRFTQHYTWEEVRDFLDVFGAPRNLRPRYNVAPTTSVDVVRHNGNGQREMVSMRWGLIPSWWKKPLSEMPATFNARVETVAEKPMYRDAYKRRRCIVPVSGFYEWTGEKKARKPHLFTASDGSPLMALAGLWDRWRDPKTGEDILSCTLIVTGATEWMTPYHDRMPAVLAQAEIDRWLRGEMSADELHPAPEATFRERRVSTRVNRADVDDDDPTVIDPVAPDEESERTLL